MSEILAILIGLGGGLALFLYGVNKISDALQAAAGNRVRTLLARFTGHPFAGVLTGAVITMLLQSSSLTTVLVVGFVSARLLTLRQATGVIMGANLGTTITIHIAAFKVTDAAWLLVGAGFLLAAVTRRDWWRQIGTMLLGLGLLFLSLEQMSAATVPLRDHPMLALWMQRVEFTPLGVLLGAVFTALIQSSSATSGLVIALVDEGVMRLPAAVNIVLGANLGTCVTAFIASWNRSAAARQAALMHVMFNAFGVALWMLLINWLVVLVEWSAPSVTRQVANAHTIFNLVNVMIMIWLIGPLTKLATWIIPDRREPVPADSVPRFLDASLLENPAIALDRARREIGPVAELVVDNLHSAKRAVLTGERHQLRELTMGDNAVDVLYESTVRYGREISRNALSQRETEELEDILVAASYLENANDLVCENLAQLGERRIDARIAISETTEQMLMELFEFVARQLALAKVAFVTRDAAAAQQIVASKSEFNEIYRRVVTHLRRRMLVSSEERLNRFQVESDIASQLQRVFYFVRRLARLSMKPDRETPNAAPAS